MARFLLSAVLFAVTATLYAQEDSTFKCSLYNKVYDIHIVINLDDKNVTVPGQDVFGEIDGYIGSGKSTQVWPIVESRIVNGSTAELEVVNNYGSEDFTAILTLEKDGTYRLKHKEGSVMKFPVNNKWQKIPGNVVFVRDEK